MRKIFLFAAAAMVSLSSCVQTSEVYTGKMQEMGFKSAVTRGIIQSNDDMTYPIAVTAVWDDAKDGDYAHYFENGKFVYDAGTLRAVWIPGMMAPPRKAPLSSTTDTVVAVPKSQMIQG